MSDLQSRYEKSLDSRAKRYGVTVTQLIDLYEQQDGKCGICSEALHILGTGNGAVDHCHDANKVRGWLCCDCNLLLGRLELKGLANFASYLTNAAMIGEVKPPTPPLPNGAKRPMGRPRSSTALTSTERSRKRRAALKAAGK